MCMEAKIPENANMHMLLIKHQIFSCDNIRINVYVKFVLNSVIVKGETLPPCGWMGKEAQQQFFSFLKSDILNKDYYCLFLCWLWP